MGLWSGGDSQFFHECKPPRKVPRFLVPAGTPCAIRNVNTGDEETPYTTTRANGFERFERYIDDETGKFYEFRGQAGYVMLVAARFVRKR